MNEFLETVPFQLHVDLIASLRSCQLREAVVFARVEHTFLGFSAIVGSQYRAHGTTTVPIRDQ